MRFEQYPCGLARFFILTALIAIGSRAPAFATEAGKEKIVFVKADPSTGVSSTHSITDLDPSSGSMTGRHDAPQFQATSAANPKTSEIAIMNSDGSGVNRLHVFGTDPSLSPDGTKIAYCSMRETLYAQIYVMNSDGTDPKRLTNIGSGDACGPVWSHDGKKIAFYAFAMVNPRRNPNIYVMDADGSNQKRLTERALEPTWSPDGKQIAFASNRDGVFQIYAMNADGSNIRRLTKHNAEDSSPAWAPDGAAIVYISQSEGDRRGLFLMGADGSDPHGIAHSKHQDFCFPAWSLDGKSIAFTSLNRLGPQAIVPGEDKPRCEVWSGEYQIFAMDSEGKMHQLANSKDMAMKPSYGRVSSAK